MTDCIIDHMYMYSYSIPKKLFCYYPKDIDQPGSDKEDDHSISTSPEV